MTRAGGDGEGTGGAAPRHADECQQPGVGAAIQREVRSGGGGEPTSAGREHPCSLASVYPRHELSSFLAANELTAWRGYSLAYLLTDGSNARMQ